jgi:F-type H+-transporting ATPase subunit b
LVADGLPGLRSLAIGSLSPAALAQETDAAAKAEQPKGDETKADETKFFEPKPMDTKAEGTGHSEGAGHDEKDAGHAHTEGGHAHHDPYDKTHANATPGLSQPQEMRFDLAIATFIIFLLLAAILAKFAWGPISDGLDKREQGIARMIDEARLAQEQAEAQLRSYEAKLAAAAEEARTIVGQARQDAEAAKERIMAEAKEAAAKERERAVEDIGNAKNAALQEIAEKSVNTAIALASNIVRREVKPEDHDRLVSDALGQFSNLN